MSTEIQWTDETWNPVTGCTKVSPGCKHCYAEGVAKRFFATKYQPVLSEGCAIKTRPRVFTDVQTHVDRLTQPLHWRQPRKVFVNSMSDLFHEEVPDEFIVQIFTVMALAPRHTFQVLTKRAERMQQLVAAPSFRDWVVAIARRNGLMLALDIPWVKKSEPMPWPLPNVWLGVSVENQQYADDRITLLTATPAAVRFVSAEPLLGPLDFSSPVLEVDCEACIDWVIIGGESGPGARPFNIEWARDILAQSRSAKVPVFVKQLGRDPRGFCSWPHHDEKPPHILDRDGVLSSISGEPGTLCHSVGDAYWPCSPRLKDKKGGDMAEWPEDLRVREFPR